MFWYKQLYHFQYYLFKKMLEPWLDANVQIVTQLSKINVWDKQSKKWSKCIMEERIEEYI